MGSLHDGHRSLIRRARSEIQTVVVSIFVNPRQFEDPSDLERYPRTLDEDLDMCRDEDVDIAFVPPVSEVYPVPPSTEVVVRSVSARLEGKSRPGHLDGVALVVTKLLVGTQPDAAYFGRKDAQQLAVVTTLAVDLTIPTRIVACSTVREADGLAVSSRNVFLSSSERIRAGSLSRGLFAAADAVEKGETRANPLELLVGAEMTDVDEIDYIRLASQDRAEPMDLLDRPAFLAVAARVGRTRLIDNVAFDISSGGFIADRGVVGEAR